MADPTAFDGIEATVCGLYRKYDEPPGLDCMPPEEEAPPELRDVYQVWQSSWQIADGVHYLGVMVLGANGVTQIGERPAYDQDQEIVLSGTLRYQTVGDACLPSVSYHSLYLELDVATLPIEVRPGPDSPPEDG